MDVPVILSDAIAVEVVRKTCEPLVRVLGAGKLGEGRRGGGVELTL